MHIDWYSIKQRPQFLAEALSDYHDLFVAYGTGRFWSRQECQVNDHLVLFPVGELPLRRKNRMAFRLDRFFCRIQLRRLIGRLKPDLIWVSFPNQFSCIPASFAGPVAYDCMDAAPEFSLNQWHRNEIAAAEERLLQCATQVFASSRRLLRIAQARAARAR